MEHKVEHKVRIMFYIGGLDKLYVYPHVFYTGDPDEASEWCVKNVVFDDVVFSRERKCAWFTREEDAALFKLFFGG